MRNKTGRSHDTLWNRAQCLLCRLLKGMTDYVVLHVHFAWKQSGSSAPWGLDVALLSEAHGLVTDLLLESATMPPQLVGGLKALANLLSPPLPFISSVAGSCNPSSSSGKDKIRHNLPHVALSDVYYASDTEEIPYTGETLLHLSKVSPKVFLCSFRANIFLHFNQISSVDWMRPIFVKKPVDLRAYK